MHKKIIVLFLLTTFPLLAATAFGQSNTFNYEVNENFAADIQPGLIEKVKAADTPMNEFQIIGKRLGVYGTVDAVPALAEKLLVWNYSHYARTALQEMPFPEAGAALRDALPLAKESRLKAGIIDSLGHRQDLEAVPMLLELIKPKGMGHYTEVVEVGDGTTVEASTWYETYDDTMVTIAAATALARIGDPAYADQLLSKMLMLGAIEDGKEKMPTLFTDICLIYGRTMATAGLDGKADEVFFEIAVNGKNAYQREAANFLILLSKSLTLRNDERLAKWLVSEDATQYNAAIRATQFLKNPAVAATMIAVFPNVSPEKQATLLASLGDQQNAEAVEFITTQLAAENEDLRNAAVLALKNSADFTGFQTLLKTAVTVDGDLQKELLSAMAKLPDSKELDVEILEALKTGDVKQKTVVANLVAMRRTDGALPIILKLCESADTPEPLDYALALLRAVGELGGLDEMELLTNLLLSLDSEWAEYTRAQVAKGLQDAIHASCVRMTDRDAAAAIIVDGINKTAGDEEKDLRMFFFTMLPVLDGPAAIKAVSEYAQSDDKQLQDFATNVMGRWMTTDIAPELLKLADTPGYGYANRALRGYLRLARQFAMEEDARREMLENAEKSPAFTDKEKEIVETIRKQYKL